ncbi:MULTISPECIES: DUF4321 domain-containing protein [Anaerosinus]|uniref:DUF4321 domain-containing protein n=1 Tax=Selenobaculum gibii TaxID=3054208 RepID=A0A9Y2AKG3_9FIRM|nr:DUF4321 domain-containing protein [Selenobaculum gbiensis]WIW71398.1 DUF4321 domain-containing protein [Selenobaculum gbiensis]
MKGKSYLAMFLFMAVGAVCGGLFGDFLITIPQLAEMVTPLSRQYTVFDFAPATMNLYIIKLSLSFCFQPSFFSLIGAGLGIYLYKRF